MLFYVDEKNIFEHSSSSEGMQLKWFKDNYYIKQDSLGYEALSEVICSILSSHISNLDYVNYDFCKVSYKDVIYTNCCYSKNFLLDGEVAKTLPRLFSNRGVNLLEFINNLPTDEALLKIKEFLKLDDNFITNIGKMLLLDAITLNNYRHFHNISLIKKENDFKLAPIFDNGGAFLSNTMEFPMNYTDVKNIRNVKSKPFSTRFSNQVKGILKLGVSPLKIDVNGVMNDISKIDVPIEYSRYLDRVKRLLDIRLRELEGKAWISI